MDNLCIRRDTEIVIEGYPRSANSTTVHGFLDRQDRPVRVVHHKHHAAQLIRAAEWGIPAVALIRRPRDAVLSNLALAEEGRRRGGSVLGRGNALTSNDAAKSWLAFYKAILPHLGWFVVAPFDDVVQDLSGTIQRVNEKFGTEFQCKSIDGSPETKLGWHARPNSIRQEIKQELGTAFAEALADKSSLRKVMEDCEELYLRVTADIH